MCFPQPFRRKKSLVIRISILNLPRMDTHCRKQRQEKTFYVKLVGFFLLNKSDVRSGNKNMPVVWKTVQQMQAYTLRQIIKADKVKCWAALFGASAAFREKGRSKRHANPCFQNLRGNSTWERSLDLHIGFPAAQQVALTDARFLPV